jgi:hypothetical protein
VSEIQKGFLIALGVLAALFVVSFALGIFRRG